MAAVKLRADTEVYPGPEDGFFICYVYDDSEAYGTDWACAKGTTEAQARMRADQIVEFCDQAVRE